MQKKYILMFAMMINVAYANTELNCQLPEISAQNKMVYFKQNPETGMASVYLIHNISKQTVVVDHVKQNVGAGAGWTSEIAADHWSALVLTQKEFNLQCAVMDKNGMEKTDCAVLKICQPMHGLKIQADSNYWLTEDKTWSQLQKELKHKHIQK